MRKYKILLSELDIKILLQVTSHLYEYDGAEIKFQIEETDYREKLYDVLDKIKQGRSK